MVCLLFRKAVTQRFLYKEVSLKNWQPVISVKRTPSQVFWYECRENFADLLLCRKPDNRRDAIQYSQGIRVRDSPQIWPLISKLK